MNKNTAKPTDPIWDSRNSDEPITRPHLKQPLNELSILLKTRREEPEQEVSALHAAVEAAWREGLTTGYSTDNYFPDEWWPKSKAFKALKKP